MGTFVVVKKEFRFYLNKNAAIKRIENSAKNKYHYFQLVIEAELLKVTNEYPR